jgi:hypothetical protein
VWGIPAYIVKQHLPLPQVKLIHVTQHMAQQRFTSLSYNRGVFHHAAVKEVPKKQEPLYSLSRASKPLIDNLKEWKNVLLKNITYINLTHLPLQWP